jgi:hypothetical protein
VNATQTTAIQGKEGSTELMPKWVRLPDDVHKELTDITLKSETYADSIKRLMKFYKEHNKVA